jgi:AMP phosphorylase
MNNTTANMLAKLHLGGHKHNNQTTKLFKSSDNFFNAKAVLLPIEDGDKLNVVLNEAQALGFGITAEDIVKLTNKNGETIVAQVALSGEIKPGTIGIYEDILERFPLVNGDPLAVEVTQSSSLANDAIRKKMKGETITYDEMYAIIKDISEGKLSEIMMTYYVASSFFYATTDEEMYQTAKAMAETGVTFKYPKGEIVADKHSIGGVPGNETTMILIPIIASLGIRIPKNFSKSITSPAATGECVNVLMDINFNKEGIEELVKKLNCCLVRGGALDLAPADDKIIKVQYPLSMQSRAKVVSSIMAKKYAMGVTHSLIDIPVGTTAKVATMEEALDWKKKFEYVGKKL